MDVIDLTCEQVEADSPNVVLLDMIDVCCEVDVGEIMTTSTQEIKVNPCSPGPSRPSSAKWEIEMSSKRQPAGCVKFIANGMDHVEDMWDDCVDDYPDSDIESQNDCFSCAIRAKTVTKDSSTQTDDQRKTIMSVGDLRNKPDVILFYTGLKSFDRFMHFFHTLEPECHDLNKPGLFEVESLDILDQFFLTLMKLRTNKDDFELSLLFGISLKSVSNIFETWVLFLYKMLTRLELWPPKDLISASMPSEVDIMYPQARVIVDCLELRINDQSAKILVGVAPSGLVSFCSKVFGGSTSESVIFELSGILPKLEPNDAVIVDKRFDVEKLCASKEVTVHPVDLKKYHGWRFPLHTDEPNNQSCTFKSLEEYLLRGNRILSQKLSSNLMPLASEICYVCIVMNNYFDA